MILNDEYNKLLREHFDFSDRKTRQFINYINESDQQNQLLAALAGALYDKIVNKSDKIDFGSIPRSRGDITKIDGYNNTVECINILRRLVVEYKEDPAIVDIEMTAIENIKSLRPVFMKAFANNASFPMMYYNITVASIQHSVSYLIAVAIQFVKDPDTRSITKALDRAAYRDAESNLVLEQLAQFNKLCANGQIEKILRESISGIRESVENDEFTEEIISTTNDVTDAIEKAPEVETDPLTDDAIDEDVIFKIAAGDYEEENEAPEQEQQPVASPFSDEEQKPDELSAGANSPDTVPDDEVEPTPVMPINGSGEPEVTQSVDEKQGSIVKRSYHKHPTANAGYGESANIVNEFNVSGIVKKSLTIGGIIVGSAAVIAVAIPIIRCFVSYLFETKAKISESLAAQANLIELNTLELQNDPTSNLSEEKKATVIEKQLKVAAKLRAWSQKWAIKDKQADKNIRKDLSEDKKTIDALKDNLSDDTLIDSGLF